MSKYLSIKDIAKSEKYPFSMGQIGHYMQNRHINGLHTAVVKIGKRLYLKEELFDRWLDSQIEQPIVIPEGIIVIKPTKSLIPVKAPIIKERNKDLDKKITDVEFSSRTEGRLKLLEIKTLGDIVKKSEKEWFKMRNVGKKFIKEIKDKLKEYNLSIKK